jgi:tetratricopeptide (TPR) repeat protein
LGLRDENKKDKYLGDALEYAQKAVKFDINNSANYELRGRIYYAQGRIKEAEDDFKKSIRLNKLNQPSYYINLALLLIGEERYGEAIDLINKILFYYPPDVVNIKKMYILKDQQETTGIEKEILYLKNLLELIKVKL